MKPTRALFLIIGLAVPILAAPLTREVPYCRMLGRAAKIAVSQPRVRPSALQVLESVAAGRLHEIPSESEAAAGLQPNQLQNPFFHELGVRKCALQSIGETGLPEAVDFLKNLKQEDFATDTTRELWAAASVGLQDAILHGIQDPQLQIEFLERTSTTLPTSDAAHWAVDQLCNRGALGSLVSIQQAIRSRWSGQYGEDEIAFCEARIRALYGKPDRAKAIGALLNAETDAANRRLVYWAISQLASMHSPEAEAELNRFVSDIRKLPLRSAGREKLQFYEQLVPRTQAALAE